ncbi:MAG TPA: hypothetical protein VHX38_08445 [Pseudonocardiaceae bacterium]|jgi:hypothetical protein|nr:hypothetical protein [Pseudonocardiaceae bacterium]
MSVINISSTEVMAGAGALIALVWVWRAGARRARAAVQAARSGGRLVSLAGRVGLNAGLIVAVQWVVVTHHPNGWLLLGVLGLPALPAAYALTRALTVTTQDMPRRRGGGHR